MLTKSPIQTVYRDARTKVTSVYIMQCFLQPQTISLHPCVSRLHPTVSILLISDDTHVLAVIHTIRQQYADIGLSLAATTSSKNVLFGLGHKCTAAQ